MEFSPTKTESSLDFTEQNKLVKYTERRVKYRISVQSN